MTAPLVSRHPLADLLQPQTGNDDPRVIEIVSDLAFHYAFNEIISGLLHRLNNQLQGVQYGVPFLAGEEEADPETVERFATLVTNGTAGTIEAVGHLSAVMTARYRRESPTAPGDVAARAVDWVSCDRRADAVHMSVTQTTAIPSIDSSFFDSVCGLTFMLNNAIENALESPDPTVQVSLSHQDQHVIFDVKDNGPAPDGSQKQYMFDVGYSTKAGHQGTGLPFAGWLAARHGGMVALIGEGSQCSFQMALPTI